MGHSAEPKVDAHTGTPTTGHEWDGICELNTPLPRWWINTLYACIVWAIGYWILYPAWPLADSYTKGLWGWSSRAALEVEVDQAAAARGAMNAQLAKASVAEIEANPELRGYARKAGAAAFGTNCAACHGAGGRGAKGYPDLTDDDWLWGGKLTDIEQTVTHGVRWDADKDTRSGAMPSFGKDGTLKGDEITDVAGYVQSIGGVKVEGSPNLEKGKALFAENCAVCHGDEGKGNQDMGAPDLTDKIWLYGSSKEVIVNRINLGGGGVMPAWAGRLDPVTIKALTVYVHDMGGGK